MEKYQAIAANSRQFLDAGAKMALSSFCDFFSFLQVFNYVVKMPILSDQCRVLVALHQPVTFENGFAFLFA